MTTTETCTFPGCPKPQKAHGLCNGHDAQSRSGRELKPLRGYVTQDPALVLGCTMLVGDTIWGSDTPGGLTSTFAELEAGDYITVVGICTVVNSTINFKMIPAGAVKA